MDHTNEPSAPTILSLFDPTLIPPEGLNNSEAVVTYLKRLTNLPQEAMVVIGFDTRNRPITTTLVAVGTVNQLVVTGRDVFRDLVRNNCAAFILAHNHPSGDPTPSKPDDILTEDAALMGVLLGIPLIDHLIVGSGTHYSYTDHGRLPIPQRR